MPATRWTPLWLRRFSDRQVLFVLAGCVAVPLAAFVLYPLWAILRMSLLTPAGQWSLVNYALFFSEPRLVGIVYNSLYMALTTTTLTILLAFVFAYAILRSAIPAKRLWALIAMSPLFAPSLVHAMGFQFLLGRSGILNMAFDLGVDIYGFWGLVLSNTLYAFPHAVLILQAALAFADQRMHESAVMLGASRWRIFWTVTLPGTRYGLMSAIFVVFTATITDFGNAIIIGGDYKVLATEIYTQVIGQANFHLGAVVSVVLLLPAAVAVGIDRWVSGRQTALVTESYVPLRVQPQRLRDGLLLGYVMAVCGALTVVIGIVIYASFVRMWPYSFALSLRHYLEADLQNGFEPLFNSIAMALTAALLGIALTTGTAYVVQKVRHPFMRALYFLSILPAAVPGMVLGLGYIFVFNDPANPLIFLYGTLPLLAINTVYHYHAQGFLTASTSLKQVSSTFDEASAMLGAGVLRTVRRITLPIVWPSLVRLGVFFFMRAMVTLSAVIFLFSPAANLAAVTVMQLEDGGNTAQAAAFSTLIMVSVVAVLALFQGLLRLMGVRDVSLIG